VRQTTLRVDYGETRKTAYSHCARVLNFRQQLLLGRGIGKIARKAVNIKPIAAPLTNA
jgi:hypothetical protein